ncbi:hypothetical protein SLA2020_407230 [Shorea laevis]
MGHKTYNSQTKNLPKNQRQQPRPKRQYDGQTPTEAQPTPSPPAPPRPDLAARPACIGAQVRRRHRKRWPRVSDIWQKRARNAGWGGS